MNLRNGAGIFYLEAHATEGHAELYERMAADDMLTPGSVIQINPTWQDAFAGCLAIVDEVKSWGVQAGCPIPDESGTKVAYVRLTWADFEYVGEATWLEGTPEEDDEDEPEAS